MSNNKYKIIYSLRIHLALQELGFICLTEMKNPKNSNFNCWVYDNTDALNAAFDTLLKEDQKNG